MKAVIIAHTISPQENESHFDFMMRAKEELEEQAGHEILSRYATQPTLHSFQVSDKPPVKILRTLAKGMSTIFSAPVKHNFDYIFWTFEHSSDPHDMQAIIAIHWLKYDPMEETIDGLN